MCYENEKIKKAIGERDRQSKNNILLIKKENRFICIDCNDRDWILQQAVCAEDLVYAGFGSNELANIIMTSAVRPFKGVVIKVCPRCQIKFPFNQFMKGTEFQ